MSDPRLRLGHPLESLSSRSLKNLCDISCPNTFQIQVNKNVMQFTDGTLAFLRSQVFILFLICCNVLISREGIEWISYINYASNIYPARAVEIHLCFYLLFHSILKTKYKRHKSHHKTLLGGKKMRHGKITKLTIFSRLLSFCRQVPELRHFTSRYSFFW